MYQHYKSLYISLPFPVKQQREMFNPALSEEREVRGLFLFKILFQIYRGIPESVL